ncbi:MAG: carboxypeptidase-like regulatory domain-containing protein [Thermoplasmata archaeon]
MMSWRRLRSSAALILVVLLVVLMAGLPAVSATPTSSTEGRSNVLEIYQANNITEQSAFSIHMEVAESSNISLVYFTFCDISADHCFLPIGMTQSSPDWYVGSTLAMSNYNGMPPGAVGGYNISIYYADGSNVSEPLPPASNPFHNLTVAFANSNEYMFEMAVINHSYNMTGVVTDSATHAAIADATVTLNAENTSPTRSTGDGDYSLSGIQNGTYTLSVAASGYRTSEMTVHVRGGNLVQDVSLSNASSPSGGKGPSTSGFGAGFFTTPTGLGSLAIVALLVVGAVAAIARSRRKGAGSAKSTASHRESGDSGPSRSR